MVRALLLGLAVLLSSAVQAQGLRVGMAADYPPLTYEQEGQVVGIEADNARAVGKILNQEVSLVVMPFAELIPSLRAGHIDIIMSGLSVTPARSEQILFTDPYMDVGQMAITHRDKVVRYAQPWSVFQEGVRVGVEPGTTGAAFAAAELPDAKITFFANPELAFAGLRKDEIDLYIHDAPTSWQLATVGDNNDLISLYKPLTEERLAWAVRLDDAPLADALNDALSKMKSSGTLRYIINRWIPVTVEIN